MPCTIKPSIDPEKKTMIKTYVIFENLNIYLYMYLILLLNIHIESFLGKTDKPNFILYSVAFINILILSFF